MNRNLISIAVIALLLTSCDANSSLADLMLIKGLYISYENGEYENAFIKCGSNETWTFIENEEYKKMSKIDEASTRSKYGELSIEVEGKYTSIDMKVYTNSHYSGLFNITEFVSYSSDMNLIEKCRDKK